jgi:ElaB/YqjD/DUF883 family membrane-anchored ribosome-binding protein
MSNTYSSTPPAQDYSSNSGGTAGAAKEQAAHVAETAAEAGGKVLGSAKEETGKVASEAKSQAKDLFEQTRTELADQAGTQQKRVASGLHSLSDELSSMAGNSQGIAGDLVGQAASRASTVADWLEQRDPGSLVDEVRRFARQKPGTFIAIAAGAGLLVGRLTRSVVSGAKDEATDAASTTTPKDTGLTAPVTPTTYAQTDEYAQASGYAQTSEEAVAVDPALDGTAGVYPDGRYPGSTTVEENRL